MKRGILLLIVWFALFLSPSAFAASEAPLNLTQSMIGLLCIGIFILAYILVMGEERLHMRKSKPVLVAAGLIWIIIGVVYAQHGYEEAAKTAFQHTLMEFSELMLFLLVAMTYINALEERRLFDALRAWLIRKRFTYKSLFWITGALAFFISPIADNLTTALLMCAVVLKVANGDRKFVSVSCVNIVVAANAGGAFSPFGDITTLMVWQAGELAFQEFLALFVPSVVNYLVPALVMSFFIA